MREIIEVTWARPTLRLALVLFVTVFAPPNARARCRPPEYRIGQNFIDRNSGSGVLYVSLRPDDLTPKQLACLALSLRDQNPSWKDVSILFFTSRYASKHFVLGMMEVPTTVVQLGEQLNAMYVLDPRKHEEYLLMMPLGAYGPKDDATRIELPIHEAIPCRLRASGRCALVLADFEYPAEALEAGASGSVVLAGTIGRDGKVFGVSSTSLSVQPSELKTVLVNVSIQNMKSWQFEPAPHDDRIRITFRYVIDASLPHGGASIVDWALPGSVTVRANTR